VSTARPRLPRRIAWSVTTAAAGALLFASALPAQGVAGGFNPRDDQYRILGLVRVQAEYERAESNLARAEELHRRQVISTQELEDRRAAYTRARVDLLQQSLSVAMVTPRVAIERAAKRRSADGRTEVNVTLRNVGAETHANRAELGIAPEILREWQPAEIPALAVSLKADPGPGGTTLSSPYERVVPRLGAGQAATVSFRLLREVDEVVISLQYGERTEERKVLLEMDSSAGAVAVQSVQFAQEADLGGQAVYDLRLERFSHDQHTFRLAALGLPTEVRFEFRDPESGARVNQVRFPGAQTQRTLQLVLTLPQRAPAALRIDEPITFEVAAFAGPAADEESAPGSTDVAGRAPSGRVGLELVARGIGRFQVRAPSLYHEIRQDGAVEMTVPVRNVGTRPIHGVRVYFDVPNGWQARAAPELIPELQVDAEERVRVVILPPAGVLVGDYEARLRTESTSSDRRVETDDKTIRIHVAGSAGWLGTGLLGMVLAALLAGIFAAGLRLARR
jgi:hypothetical protein